MNCERCTYLRIAMEKEVQPAVAYVKAGSGWWAVCEDCITEARRIEGLAGGRDRAGPIEFESEKKC